MSRPRKDTIKTDSLDFAFVGSAPQSVVSKGAAKGSSATDAVLQQFDSEVVGVVSGHRSTIQLDYADFEFASCSQPSQSKRRKSAALLTPLRDSSSESAKLMSAFADKNDLYFHLRETKCGTMHMEGGLVSSGGFLPHKQHCQQRISQLAKELDHLLTKKETGAPMRDTLTEIEKVRKIRRHVYNIEHQMSGFLDGVRKRDVELSEMQAELKERKQRAEALSSSILDGEAFVVANLLSPIVSKSLRRMEVAKQRFGDDHSDFVDMSQFVDELKDCCNELKTVSGSVLSECRQIEQSYEGLSKQRAALSKQSEKAHGMAMRELMAVQTHYGMPLFFSNDGDYYSRNQSIVEAISRYTRSDALDCSQYYNLALNAFELQQLLTAPGNGVAPKPGSHLTAKSASENWAYICGFTQVVCTTLIDCQLLYDFVSSHLSSDSSLSVFDIMKRCIGEEAESDSPLRDSIGIEMAQSLQPSECCLTHGMDHLRSRHSHANFPSSLWETVKILANVCSDIPEAQLENVISHIAVALAAKLTEVTSFEAVSKKKEDLAAKCWNEFSSMAPFLVDDREAARKMLSAIVCSHLLPGIIKVISAVSEDDSFSIAAQILYTVFGICDYH